MPAVLSPHCPNSACVLPGTSPASLLKLPDVSVMKSVLTTSVISHQRPFGGASVFATHTWVGKRAQPAPKQALFFRKRGGVTAPNFRHLQAPPRAGAWAERKVKVKRSARTLPSVCGRNWPGDWTKHLASRVFICEMGCLALPRNVMRHMSCKGAIQHHAWPIVSPPAWLRRLAKAALGWENVHGFQACSVLGVAMGPWVNGLSSPSFHHTSSFALKE